MTEEPLFSEVWGWRDARTGERASVTAARTREQAEEQLAVWVKRDARGKRPDLHELIPFLEVYQIQ